jgi:hypothetical protein
MFDVIYLGIFIILSRALDPRFDDLTNPPRALDEEIASAESHFHSLLHFFEDHYFMILEDVVMHPSYVVKRLLAEFAAAILFFAKAIEGFQRGDSEMDDAEVGEDRDVIRYSKLKVQLRHLIRRSYSDLIPYYEHCVAIGHQDFGWSGPDVRILPKTKGWASTIPFLVSDGELLDHPTFSIYNPAAPPSSATVAHTPLFSMPASKRRGSGNIDDLEAKKQRS